MAATAVGIPWADDGDRSGGLPVDVLCRVFDVDHIAEQPIWLNTRALPHGRILPDGGFPMPWTDADELLYDLTFAVAIPFYWRHQLPLFFLSTSFTRSFLPATTRGRSGATRSTPTTGTRFVPPLA